MFDKYASAKICETSGPDFMLTAVVTQDKEHKRSCCEPYYTSILVVEPNDTVGILSSFTVSCSVNDENLTAASMNLVRNKTTHHRFEGLLIFNISVSTQWFGLD